MHDIRAIRDTPDAFIAGWSARGVEDAKAVVARILELDRALRTAQTAGQTALAERNAASKSIGAAMGKGDKAEAERLKGQVETLKATIAAAEADERRLKAELHDVLAALPNLAADDVPDGEDETKNEVKKSWGGPESVPAAKLKQAKDHADLGEALGLLDFEAAARMSGARFAVLKGGLARLERALGQFMLDMQTGRHGYLEVNPPYLVNDDAMFGTGQLPKFGEDLFFPTELRKPPFQNALDSDLKQWRNFLAHGRFSVSPASLSADEWSLWQEIGIRGVDALPRAQSWKLIEAFQRAEVLALGGSRRWLIPTAEVSLTNLVREQILSEDELAQPMRLTALTPCFRAEAGSAGRDTRGLIRQHQFSKVELVSITRPEDSEAEHERMTGCAEAVLEALELPYRRVLLCKGDMGFSARKTFDLEVWLPSQGTFREISSCSNCGDFQARRMDARFKRAGEKKTEFVHTLNGSGLAVGRTLVAVMENFQDEGGRVFIPEPLRRYMPEGVTHVEAAQ